MDAFLCIITSRTFVQNVIHIKDNTFSEIKKRGRKNIPD